MSSPLTWATLALVALLILCATNRRRWRHILTDAALLITVMLTACAPLLIRS